MTMVSFRADDADVRSLDACARRLGTDRSDLLRTALRHHLVRLASEEDVAAWRRTPLEPGERALADAADWGPAEDWSDWFDAAR